MPEWTTACPDWAERLKKGQSIIPAPIYPEQAEIALNVFRQLKIVDAPGSPTFGESCAQWVFDLVAALFGSYDAETGRRHITEVFVLIPKKNSKSTLAAGIMMTALLLNWRQAAGYTIIAPTVEVATNAFNPARDMVKRDDDLDDLCQVQTHIRTITHRGTDTTLKVVAADPNTVSGIKSVGTLIDELWLFGKQHNSEDMLREAVGGMASRPEGFVMYTTTQSNEPPAGLWRAYEKTHGMRGWECLVDGVAGIDIQQSELRCFTLTVNRTSGASETKSFDVPVMIYQGVFKSGQEYLPGDTVTWGGSLWHCDEQTQDKPGEAGSKGWTLAAKRGRDGRGYS